MHGGEVAQELLVADDQKARRVLAVLALRAPPGVRRRTAMGASVVACHSRTHCGLSAAGTMSSPRATRPARKSAWHAATACVVLPSPMSSARSSRSSSKKRRTPSRW